MDEIRAAHAMPQAQAYSFQYSSKKIWIILAYQLSLCVISSIILSYILCREFYANRKKTWKKAIDVIKPISKRLQTLEKEKIIWKSYLEWMEDYCVIYYGLLHYLNSTTLDLGKMYRNHNNALRNLSNQAIHPINPVGEVHNEEEHSSEATWDVDES